MTVIYLDTLFLLNAVMDYLLLLCAARLAGEELHRLRMAAGGVLGGVYASAAVLPQMEFLLHPLCKLASAVLMVVVGLGKSRRLLRQCIIFFALACAFGGGVLAIALLGGTGMSLGGGLIYSGMDVKTVLLSAAGCYVLLTLSMSRMARHGSTEGELVPVRVRLFDKEIGFTALRDTGNTLTDPMTGRGVAVVEAERLTGTLLKELSLTLEELSAPERLLERLNRGRWRGRFRLLPYRSVGVSCGLLLAVRVDHLWVDGAKRRNVLVALSPTPVSDGGGYGALVGAAKESEAVLCSGGS